MTVGEADVLVVGAGPAGLVISLLLARQGVSVQCVDKHPGVSALPRARGIHARAAEILRQCGVEADMRAAQLEITPRMELRSTLRTPPTASISTGGPSLSEVSPCEGIAISQDVFEGVLRRHVDEHPLAALSPSTELVGVDQSSSGVRANLVDRRTGLTPTVRARYLIGADGWRSRVRSALGLSLHGPADLGTTRAVTFRADLTGWVDEPPPALIQLTDAPAILLRTHSDHRWVLFVPDGPELPEAPEVLVRSALGVEAFKVDVLTDSRWVAAAQTADRFGDGRVFLIGDAAHRVPPSGATGISSAVADAHNLAWKIAAVLHGWGGDHLLTSYAAERQPVAVTTTAAALAMWESLHSGGEPGGVDLRMLDMGYQYCSTVTGGGGPTISAAPLASLGGPYRPSAAAGARAPHVWLDGSAAGRSTLDLFGNGFMLLTGHAGTAWQLAAALISGSGPPFASTCCRCPDAALRKVPLVITPVNEPAFATAYELSSQGAVLVRPDGHVAERWRSGPLDVPSAAHQLAAALSAATGQ